MKKCREVMTRDPVWCVSTDTVARIAKLMKTENIGSVPLLRRSPRQETFGHLTDRDLNVSIELDNSLAGLSM